MITANQPGDHRLWGTAAALALALHVAAAVAALLAVVPGKPVAPDPVVLIELPPESAPPAPRDRTPPQAQQQAALVAPPQPRPVSALPPPIDALPIATPPPKAAVVLPPPAPSVTELRQPEVRPAIIPAAAPIAAPAPSDALNNSAIDPRAKKQEANYFALLSAHLNRRKSYPPEARQARQQGIVTIRFTVDRGGNVSSALIKRSSGHAVLDDATLKLLQRVAPLPRMPESMQRERVTVSLPIEYSLRTS